MAQIIDEIRGLYQLYPSWLVTLCLVVVGIGLGVILWKVLRASIVLMVALLLLGIALFAGFMILAP